MCLVKRGISVIFCQSFHHFLRKSTWQTKSAWEPSCQDPTLPETWMKCCRELLCYGKYWKELLSLLLCKVLVSAAHCFNENWEDNSWCSNMIFLLFWKKAKWRFQVNTLIIRYVRLGDNYITKKDPSEQTFQVCFISCGLPFHQQSNIITLVHE